MEILKATNGENHSGTLRPEDMAARTTSLAPELPPPAKEPFYRPAPAGAMHVYHLDDGAEYWIAAERVDDAFRCYAETDPDLAEEQAEAWKTGIRIRRMSPDGAARVPIRCDDDLELRSAAELASTATKPCIIGCSEW